MEGWKLGRSFKTRQSLKDNYNYTSKGMLGKTQSDYQKEQVRKALKGKNKSAQAKANMSIARLGKKKYINLDTKIAVYIYPEEAAEYEKRGYQKVSKK